MDTLLLFTVLSSCFLQCNAVVSDVKHRCILIFLLLHTFQNMVGDELLKERLDMETLESSALIASKNNFNQKYVKTKTKLL